MRSFNGQYLGRPVINLAHSYWIRSSCKAWSLVRLPSQTTSPYSRMDGIWAMYIIFNDLRFSLYFRDFNIPILLQVQSIILLMSSFQFAELFTISPRCLCEVTVSMNDPLIDRLNLAGCFVVTVITLVFLELRVTCQVSAQFCNLTSCWLVMGVMSVRGEWVKRTEVSSANNLVSLSLL